MTKVLRSVVTGVGGYLPDEIVTNDDLAKVVDTTDEWIVERTGIRQRHRAAEGQAVSDLAVEAARRALAAAGKTPADVDLIIVGTTTPDLTFPATATIVQRKLGCPVGIAFDVQAVCSGFVYALSTAATSHTMDVVGAVPITNAGENTVPRLQAELPKENHIGSTRKWF